jgi:hypothetical protein
MWRKFVFPYFKALMKLTNGWNWEKSRKNPVVLDSIRRENSDSDTRRRKYVQELDSLWTNLDLNHAPPNSKYPCLGGISVNLTLWYVCYTTYSRSITVHVTPALMLLVQAWQRTGSQCVTPSDHHQVKYKDINTLFVFKFNWKGEIGFFFLRKEH